jgi:hypothetical protein
VNEKQSIRAMKQVIQSWGLAQAAMLFRGTLSQETDYLQIKEELFSDRSVSDLCCEIKGSEPK